MALRVDSQKQRYWLELVRSWQQSGLSVRAYCRRHRLSEASFFAWRRALRRRGLFQDPVTKGSPDTTAAAPAFVRVAVPTPKEAAAVALEVVLARGRRLRVRPGFDHETLRQLVLLLEEEPAC